jgi:hypothetical protein
MKTKLLAVLTGMALAVIPLFVACTLRAQSNPDTFTSNWLAVLT